MGEQADLRNSLQNCDVDREKGWDLERLIDYGLETTDRELLERFLTSTVLSNRQIALDGLVTYLGLGGYESDTLLLHLDGIGSDEVADIVGVRLLYTLANRGDAQAARCLVNLGHRGGWTENYANVLIVD